MNWVLLILKNRQPWNRLASDSLDVSRNLKLRNKLKLGTKKNGRKKERRTRSRKRLVEFYREKFIALVRTR